MELKHIFEIQKTFDQKMGWNRYEKCETPEQIIDFMKHYINGNNRRTGRNLQNQERE